MYKFIIKAIVTVVLFFFIYNPPVIYSPVNTGMVVGGAFFIFYIVQTLVKIALSKKIAINKYLLQLILLIALAAFYSFLIATVNNAGNIQLSKSYAAILIYYLPGAFGIVSILKKYCTAIDILEIFIIVTVIQSIILLSMFVNPAIKDFFFSLLRDADNRNTENLMSGGFRFLGFAFGATWDLSIVQSLGVMSIALLVKIDRSKVNLKNALFFLLVSMSVFLAGRTGVLGVVFALLILLIPVKKYEIPLYKFLKFGGIICLVIVASFYFIRNSIPPAVLDTVENNFLPWALEIAQNDNGGKLETRSSNELKTMYFVPATKTLLIGDGYYVDPIDPNKYYMGTDGGYMRHLLFYGIIGSFFLVALYALLFYQMHKFAYALYPSAAVKLFMLFFCLYFFISHIKGDLLAGSNMPLKALYFFYAILLLYRPANDDTISHLSTNK